MTKKKKKILLSVLLVTLFLGSLWYYNHYYTGSRSGTVVDAVTGKPIEGAVVTMEWFFAGGFFIPEGGALAAFYETKTDERGRYKIPNLHINGGYWHSTLEHENVMIYKDGYSGYEVSDSSSPKSGYSFASNSEDQPYSKKRNFVKLFPFKSSDSHREHIEWIQTFPYSGCPEKLLEKELQNEMERAKKDYK
ncbi:MAG TPA: carboxypeptidase-like regulatory domain-containing protein [Sedimentisphaerales bacterium]|nr:carboxypeptidase-like regulatory domain-containing protein [Sedimentisphaerales bacterium]